MSHNSEDFFGNIYNHKSIKDGLGGPIVGRVEAVKEYKNSKYKWKKELEALQK